MSCALRVSVVIANYNYGQFLPELFQALAGQTIGPQSLEVLLVDDGSTDDSLKAAAAWQEAHPFHALRIFRGAHKGHPAPVRNKGFSNARAPRLIYIDADDIPRPDFLLQLSQALDQGADLAYSAVRHAQAGSERVILLPQFDPELLRTQNIVTSTAMMTRAVWQASQGFRDNTAYEDWDFWVRAAMNGFTFTRLEEPLLLYRSHEANFSHQAQRRDAAAKAAIVCNNEAFFPPPVVRWAKGVMQGEPWADPLPRGLIPTAHQALALAQRG